jgi:solute carrier family 25 carnitine/acylcarnitine transporter 20/29
MSTSSPSSSFQRSSIEFLPYPLNHLNGSHLSAFIAGSVSGAAGVTVGHPFDSLKVRLQVGLKLTHQKLDFATIKQLYRGILPPIATVGTLQAINFSNYEFFKRAFPKYMYPFHQHQLDSDEHPGRNTLFTIFCSGFASGSVISLITSPMNIVKIRMQVESEAGLFTCMRDIYRVKGFTTFYRGYTTALATEGPGRGIYLWTYEYTKLQIVRLRYGDDYHHKPGRIVTDSKYIDLSTRILSAIIAGVFSWLAIYPLDVIKSKVQLDISKQRYSSSWDCIKKTFRNEGMTGFFRGLTYTLLRAGPVSATILPVYDLTKEFCESKFL